MFARRSLITAITMLILLSVVPAWCADEAIPGTAAASGADIRQLGSEVDVLRIVTDLGFTKDQITQLAAKVALINAKRQEYAKKEQAILEKVKIPLQQMKDALTEGKPVPASAQAVADSGFKELEALSKQGWADYDSYVASAIKLITPKQLREFRRSPEARKRAGEMIQDIRFCSEDKYPQIREKLVNELLEVKKIDKQEEWRKIGEEKLAGTSGEERAQAVKELEQIRENDLADMKAELSGLLDSIRAADSRVLSVGVDRLASALRSDAEVDKELRGMMMQILDSPTAEAVLKARAEKMKDSTETQ